MDTKEIIKQFWDWRTNLIHNKYQLLLAQNYGKKRHLKIVKDEKQGLRLSDLSAKN